MHRQADQTHHFRVDHCHLFSLNLMKTHFVIHCGLFPFSAAVKPLLSLQIFRAQLTRHLNICLFRRGAVWTFKHLHSVYCMILERWLPCDPTREAVVRVMMITQQCQLSGPSTRCCVIQSLRQRCAFFLGRWWFTVEVWEACECLWRGCERASADWRI